MDSVRLWQRRNATAARCRERKRCTKPMCPGRRRRHGYPASEQSLPSLHHDAVRPALPSNFSHSPEHFSRERLVSDNPCPPTGYLLAIRKTNYLREILLEIIGVQINVTVRHFTVHRRSLHLTKAPSLKGWRCILWKKRVGELHYVSRLRTDVTSLRHLYSLGRAMTEGIEGGVGRLERRRVANTVGR